MRAVLVDAGPRVALLDRSDGHHQEVVGVPKKFFRSKVWPDLRLVDLVASTGDLFSFAILPVDDYTIGR